VVRQRYGDSGWHYRLGVQPRVAHGPVLCRCSFLSRRAMPSPLLGLLAGSPPSPERAPTTLPLFAGNAWPRRAAASPSAGLHAITAALHASLPSVSWIIRTRAKRRAACRYLSLSPSTAHLLARHFTTNALTTRLKHYLPTLPAIHFLVFAQGSVRRLTP